MSKLAVDLKVFEKIFPFSFITDKKGRLLKMGRSFSKLMPELKKRDSLLSAYKINRPSNLSLEKIMEEGLEEMIILQDQKNQYQLMGQIVKFDHKDRYLFVVNVFINDIKKLSYLNLTYNDFAIQDQVFDFLMLLQTHEKSIREADLLNKKLAQSNELAIKTSALKSQFLANMSHELRTPMNGVLGMASVLIETELTIEQKDYTDGIIYSAENMLTLINDILDLSKIEAGFIQLQDLPVRFNSIVDDVFQVVKVSALKKNIELIKSIDPSCLRDFRGDPDRLRQIILNFVGNAVKFTAKGSISVNIQFIDDKSNRTKLLICIEDTGIGMKAETLDEIFSPFVQGDSSTTKKFGGTGLGLSICKKLISAMKGEVGVESQVGVGSKFWFTLELENELKKL